MAKTKVSQPTRFRIFVLPRYSESSLAATPETITVSVTTDKIRKGPADDRMYVRDAQFKEPYDEFQGPPYRGQTHPAVKPDTSGHFDHLDVNSREFLCATMYATVRRTLDIWEGYFGRKIPWFFRADLKRLELIPLIEWDNAQSGYGFLEFGYARMAGGGADKRRPYCENFDVLAHELGHNILFSEVGVPSTRAADTVFYGGFHESGADLVAIVATLHFQTIVDHLLDSSKGNLFSENELSRIGEVSQSSQIRLALNYEKMSTVDDEPHNLSQPLTGAVFDIFVEMYQKELVSAGLITQDLADRSFGPEGGIVDPEALEAEFTTAYVGHEAQFKKCLEKSRDDFGRLLATAWQKLSPDNLTYTDVAIALLDADDALFAGRHEDTIRVCFRWREIGLPADSRLRTRFSVEGCQGRQATVVGRSHASPAALRVPPGGKARGVTAEADEIDRLEWAIYQVAVGGGVGEGDDQPALVWIDQSTDFFAFKGGKVGQLLFHRSGSAPGQIDSWATVFADRLLLALRFWQYAVRPGALPAIKQVAAQADAPMQSLLDVVAQFAS